MSRFLTDSLRTLKAYVPGEQPRDRSYVKLNTNESPFPPSPEVVKAVENDQARSLNLYSDPTALPLRKAIADRYGLTPGCVSAGNGSDEVLGFCFQAFAGNGTFCFPDVTYGLYPVFCGLYGIPFERIPLTDSLSVGVEDYKGKDGVAVIANPNAQTGVYLPPEKIRELLEQDRDRLVIVDEAYIDFGGASSAALIPEYDNLVVVQTFSKSRNLAGARVGFALADPSLIRDIELVRCSFNPYNVNRLSMAAAVRAIRDDTYFLLCTQAIRENREITVKRLKDLGFSCTDSLANFILAKSPDVGGEELYLALKERGVLVRHFGEPRIRDSVRITVGSAEQMSVLLKKIEEILDERRAAV